MRSRSTPRLPRLRASFSCTASARMAWTSCRSWTSLALPDATPVRFVFPHAPQRPVTVNAGFVMRAWYDIKAFTPDGRADAAGLEESVRRVNARLDHEVAQGIEASSIVLAGFSQGGAVALSAGLRYRRRLAGVLRSPPISPSLPGSPPNDRRRTRTCRSSMCHGRMDPVVPIAMGLEARVALQPRLSARVARVSDAARGLPARNRRGRPLAEDTYRREAPGA